ncbi:carbamoyltransferase HypF [Mariprofundus erugo]|uniref:carbamoyltransferase HypF n=1 Tax=Mariprofundus erugo TaxID=2528639 RepID=UPI0010FD56F3|nr:carbamoyltransferase HypF [Mariprofundus erugo]TLS77129.1 carbamoyltransferase HypF [Mariprofundus erugo]
MTAITIRIRGLVQGVGFRPFIWHLATELGITGSVRNDGEGVRIDAWGESETLERFRLLITAQPPPLARIDALEQMAGDMAARPDQFVIAASDCSTSIHATPVTPDAALCPACMAEIHTPSSRFFDYPFTSCTHCGPRLSIVRATPYDRANTSMAPFPMCASCQREYDDPANRRFHAQAHACPACGPSIWLEDASGRRSDTETATAILDRTAALLSQGLILAIKGTGGIQLAVDATNHAAVTRLRRLKQRYDKPFALMGRDIAAIACHASVTPAEAELLSSAAAPIVLLAPHPQQSKNTHRPLATAIAPGQSRLGFMLPNSPLHSLLMARLQHPIVLTSGNRSDEPQCIDNSDARDHLAGIADHFLLHNRDIVNRLDDSVVTFMAEAPRLLRRARGYAPSPLLLHHSFARCGHILAMGSEMKNTFCQLSGREAILSQHTGDLEHAATRHDYHHALELYRQLFAFNPACIAIDQHPDYLSGRIGTDMAGQERIPLLPIQHHHAHIAAVMAEHQLPLDSKPVLGIALDGLGFGSDGTLWGGEFLLADYCHYKRLACFQPVPMPGGTQAIREPWRNCFAHLHAAGWDDISRRFSDTDIIRFLHTRPLPVLHRMIEQGINTPASSSCGRLFDAVAAALAICRHQVSYEGQAAIELEHLARSAWSRHTPAYPYRLERHADTLQIIHWQPMWQALLNDLQQQLPVAEIAARFHRTLSHVITALAQQLCHSHATAIVVLCGGAFQNRLLLEAVTADLADKTPQLLIAGQTPLNDGGLALGQAAIAAATQWTKGAQHD